MELPLYVWRPHTNIRRRQKRPLGEILRDWIARIAGDGRHGVPAS